MQIFVVIVYTHQIGHDVSTRESGGIFVYATQIGYFLWFYKYEGVSFCDKKKKTLCICVRYMIYYQIVKVFKKP